MPAYYPFLDTTRRSMDRALMPVEWNGDRFDYDRLDAELAGCDARVWILCHPHNPTGHVFDRTELERVAELAERHDITVIADEVHADLTLYPAWHVAFASFGPGGRGAHRHDDVGLEVVQPGRHALGGDALRKRCLAGSARCAAGHYLGAPNLMGVVATVGGVDPGGDVARRRARGARREPPDADDLLAEQLPGQSATGRRRRPIWPGSTSASAGLGDDPAAVLPRTRRRWSAPACSSARRAAGHVRLNIATSPAILGRDREGDGGLTPAFGRIRRTVAVACSTDPSPSRSPPAWWRRSTRAGSPCCRRTCGAFVGLQDRPGRLGAVGRALAVSAVLTAGFVTVFGLLGIVFSGVLEEVQQYAPWFTIVFGLIVVGDRHLPADRARAGALAPQARARAARTARCPRCTCSECRTQSPRCRARSPRSSS